MIRIYKHRSNNFSELKDLRNINTKHEVGLEFDLRYHLGNEYLNHDIESNLNNCFFIDKGNNDLIDLHAIINFKETGLEIRTFKKISKIFRSTLILDLPFPEFINFKKEGLSKFIIWRISEYEKPKISDIKYFQSKWIWLDSFNSYWFDESDILKYRDAGLKIILVSNELQGRNIESNHDLIRELFRKNLIDAVCTKDINFYMKLIEN